jgi:sulfur-oxidizing protein SoxY
MRGEPRTNARPPMFLSRRGVIITGAAGLTTLVAPRPASAAEDFTTILNGITKGAPVRKGRVKLTLPELAENGNVVSTQIEVESPMTAQDHVKAVHVLAEKNPQVLLVRFHLGPRAGRVKLATNVRLADTQRVTCLAEMSDGSFWSGETQVIVTLAACVDSG